MSLAQSSITTSASDRIPLFALLIGINKYEMPPGPGMPALQGAVTDVTLFKDYLENHLGVPRRQIKLLVDEDAIRSAIISAIENLKGNPDIQYEDAIVIYFAGHGAEINAPHKWECGDRDGKIQAIVPYDCDAMRPDGQRVPPIPDHTINCLLSAVAQKHGNNITVIFDCCHSASGTRAPHGADTSEPTARSVDLSSRHYPSTLDQQILLESSSVTRGTYIASQYVHQGLGSHILLAACASKGLAYESFIVPEGGLERVKCGRFSAALLKLLHRKSAHLILYSDILSLIGPIQDQKAHCEGLHKDRYLFGARVQPAAFQGSFEVTYRSDINERSGYYIIEAGKIHNITAKSEFEVYFDSDSTLSYPLGVLAAKSVGDFKTTAIPMNDGDHFDINAGPTGKAIAILMNPHRVYSLLIWKNPGSKTLEDLYKLIKDEYKMQLRDVEITKTQRTSDINLLEVAQDNTISLRLEIFAGPTSHPQAPNFSRRIDNITIDETYTLSSILWHASNFYGELKRPDNNRDISQKIGIEFYELVPDITIISDVDATDYLPVLMPKTHENLFKDGAINLKMPAPHLAGDDWDRTPYGLKLTNRTNLDLYVNMLHFSNGDLSIGALITYPDGPYSSDILLRRGVQGSDGVVLPGTLAIGYGSAGYAPINFDLDPDINFDLDFLKIYLSTQPVDLSYLKQDSPFGSQSTPRKIVPHVPRPVVSWSHVTIPIFQSRQ